GRQPTRDRRLAVVHRQRHGHRLGAHARRRPADAMAAPPQHEM
ncbi:uncharacterized protein METZ01_LOCUS240857, partial [marine metagenome]